MSTSDTLAFLTKLHDSLDKNKAKGATQIYRNLVANKRVHIFRFSSKEMANQMKIELEMDTNFGTLTQKDRQVINSKAEEMHSELAIELRRLETFSSKYRETKNTLYFRFDENTETGKVITLRSGRTIDVDPTDIFEKVKSAYRPALKNFFTGVQDHLRSTTEVNPETGRMRHRALRTDSGKVRKAPGKYFHAGHEKGAGIFESYLRDVFEGIAGSAGLDTEVVKDDVAHVLGAKTLLLLIRDDAKDTHTIKIESAYLNTLAKEGGLDVASLKNQLKKELLAAIDKVAEAEKLGKGIEGLKGSDSILEKKKKQALTKIVAPFKKLKYVKVTTKRDLRVKSSSYTRKKSVKGPRVTSVPFAISGKGITASKGSKSTSRGSGESAASAPLQMIAQINKELPNVVRNNMRQPALVNRTGTFAESVKVTDVQQTPKGFPSIGYTYKKDPYEVFEMGSEGNWATPERDPRRLIEGSIREIAANMAMGRFYMRRV